MHHFHYPDTDLYCEEVPVSRIAAQVGTPFYLYSHATLTQHFRAVDDAFRPIPHLICFAMKANASLALLKLLSSLGSGADIVSGGELFRALRAGIPPRRIVYAGMGKTREEMEQALKADILMFNVESAEELHLLNTVAAGMGSRARVALRVNPDVDPQTHPYIATGLKKSKFGIDIARALERYETARTLPHIEVVGVHQHIGSQITEVGPFVDSLTKTAELVRALRARGFDIRYLDVGGGLGITYKDEDPPALSSFAEALIRVIQDLSCTVILEPGRVIVGNAGILVTRILYTKRTAAKTFVVVDAGMNDLIRPSLYGAYHEILPVRKPTEVGEIVADVVGPICESGDFLAQNRLLPDLPPGDLVAVMSAGAYGFTMSSNYNARPRVPEVMVKGSRIFVVRERESYEDLVRGEQIPEEL